MSNGERQRSSIFAGLLLIVLGVLFLLARFHPDLRIWHLFWRFWPVLIILWGFAKLVDHLGAQRTGETRPPLLSGGEAALLVLIVLVLAGMGIYSKIRERNPDLNFDVGLFDHQASNSEELPPRPIPAGSHITLTTDRGSISVHAGDGNDLRVSASETSEGANDTAAQERLKSVKVVIEQTNGGFSVHPVNQDDGGGRVTVDFDVTVPKSVSLTASSNHGDITISGVGGAVNATSQLGDIEVHNAGSDVTAQLEKGDARVTEIAGSVRITGRGNEIELNDVAGDATVQGEFFGPVRIRNVTRTTHYTSQAVDLTLVHVTGRLELDSGEVDVSDVGGFAKLITRNKDIQVENVAGRLDITGTHGDIKVTYSQPPREEINIANESGGVDLTLPSKSNFEISAISRSGDVQSDFEGSGLKPATDSETGRLSGRIGSLGPQIDIATSYGTIYLRKSS
ncbi:MAG: DUF4097 family beta strand repeat-containing protein [Candidatus Acidiferrales bacterium]